MEADQDETEISLFSLRHNGAVEGEVTSLSERPVKAPSETQNPSAATAPAEHHPHGGDNSFFDSEEEHSTLYLPLHIHQPVQLFTPPTEPSEDDPGPPPPLPPDDADESWSAQISPRTRPPPAPPAPPVIIYYNAKEKETTEKSKKKRGGITQEELGSFPWEKFDLKPKVVRIKDYVVIRTLGSGTYGTVKLARNEKTGEMVALKVIKKATLSEEDLQRIQRELKIITMLSHPNIIKVFDVLDTKKVTYIVMEYCSGGDLRKYIKSQPKGRLPPAQALPLFRQILCGLSYCHQHLVIHRDIKPENILLTNDLTAKIGDFGFSRTFNLRTAMQTACGSLAYAAPEVIDATIRGYIGAKSDVWSMGCVLYEMLSGDLPFFEQFEWETIREIKLGRYRDTNKVHKKLLVLIERMLTPDPTKRASLREIQVHPYTWLDRPLMYALVLPFCKAILEKRGNIYSINSEDFDIDLEEDEYITKRKETQEREEPEEPVGFNEEESTVRRNESSEDSSHSSEASEKEEAEQLPGHRRTKSSEHKPEPLTRQHSATKQITEQQPNGAKDRTKPRQVHLEPVVEESSGVLKAKSAEDRPEEPAGDEERLRKEGEGESNAPTTRMKRSFSDPTRFQINKPSKKKNSVPEVTQVSVLSPRKNSMFSWIRSGTTSTGLATTQEESTPEGPLSSSGNHPSASTSEEKVPPLNLAKSPPLSPRNARSPPNSPKKVKSPPISPRKLAAEHREREKAKEKEEKKQRKEKEKEEKKKKMKEEKEGKLREKKEKEEKLREKKDLKRKMKEEEKSQRALKTSKRKETPQQHHRKVSSSSRERPEIPSPPSPPPVHRVQPSNNPPTTWHDRKMSAPPLPTTTFATLSTTTNTIPMPQTARTESKTSTKEMKEKRYRRSVSASDLFAESPGRRLLRTNSFTSDGEEDVAGVGAEPERPRAHITKPKKPVHSTLPKKLYFFKNN